MRYRLIPVWAAWLMVWIGAPEVRAAPPPPIEGGFTLVVVPDSQKYVWKRPELYTLQTGWIAANVARYRLAYLLHVGDVTQHNTDEEWALARRAHRVYEGLLPCAYVPGNHDYGSNGKTTGRDSRMSEYISLADYRKQPGFGGVYDREQDSTLNSFHLFEAGGRRWLILALEFGPRNDVVRWANEVVANHADRSVILITHAYLKPDGTRFDRRVPYLRADGRDRGLDRYPIAKSARDGFNDGEDLWEKLVSRHANFSLVLCGHVCTSAHLVSVGVHGNRVHQILVDYQDADYGGNGWLRLLQFLPDGKTVRVRDYSPLLDQTSSDPACAFDFELSPALEGNDGGSSEQGSPTARSGHASPAVAARVAPGALPDRTGEL